MRPTLDQIESALSRCPPDAAAVIRAALPGPVGRDRLDARDDAIRATASLFPEITSSRALAKALATAMRRAACLTVEPTDLRLRAAWTILQLNDGDCLGECQLRNILAGLRSWPDPG